MEELTVAKDEGGKKSPLLLILIVLLLLSSLGLWGYVLLRDCPTVCEDDEEKEETENTEDESEILYERVEVQSLDKSESYGFVWVDDGKIMTDITVDDVLSFINQNKESWETVEQEYPIGGMEDDGALWDGVQRVSIGDENFIIAVYIQLDEEFSQKYYVDLVEEGSSSNDEADIVESVDETNYISKTMSCEYATYKSDISFEYPDFVTFTDTTPVDQPTLCRYEMAYNSGSLQFYYYPGPDGPIPTDLVDGYVVVGQYDGKDIVRNPLVFQSETSMYTTEYGAIETTEEGCTSWSMEQPSVPCFKTGYLLTGTGSGHRVMIFEDLSEDEIAEILEVFDAIVMSTVVTPR